MATITKRIHDLLTPLVVPLFRTLKGLSTLDPIFILLTLQSEFLILLQIKWQKLKTE
jgi:hypothetical protein